MNYGPVMMDLEGTELSAIERELIQHPRVGGIIFFTRNYRDVKQIKDLVQEIRSTAKHPLLLAVDHEGGRVWRFKDGFNKLGPASYYGVAYEKDPKPALQWAYDAGWVMAAELLECGIDLSLAPILDLNKGVSEVIGDRAFHRDPQIVSEVARAFIQGMNHVGMSATGKHFPGHGSCAPDTHFAQAVDPRSLEAILNDDLIPFQKLAGLLGGVMPAHITFSSVDSVPVGFSARWLKTILREQIQFEGAIISDCLSMMGASIGGDFVMRSQMALDAGCDMIILCQQKRELLAWVLENLNRDGNRESSQRLSNLAGDFQNKARTDRKPELADLGTLC